MTFINEQETRRLSILFISCHLSKNMSYYSNLLCRQKSYSRHYKCSINSTNVVFTAIHCMYTYIQSFVRPFRCSGSKRDELFKWKSHCISNKRISYVTNYLRTTSRKVIMTSLRAQDSCHSMCRQI